MSLQRVAAQQPSAMPTGCTHGTRKTLLPIPARGL